MSQVNIAGAVIRYGNNKAVLLNGFERRLCPSCGTEFCNWSCDGSQGADPSNKETEPMERIQYNTILQSVERLLVEMAAGGLITPNNRLALESCVQKVISLADKSSEGKKPIGYRYTDENGDSLTECPECGNDLTAEGGVGIEVVVAGTAFTLPSSLNNHGELVDTPDGAVAKGYHSSTKCGKCEEDLLTMDGVNEERN